MFYFQFALLSSFVILLLFFLIFFFYIFLSLHLFSQNSLCVLTIHSTTIPFTIRLRMGAMSVRLSVRPVRVSFELQKKLARQDEIPQRQRETSLTEFRYQMRSGDQPVYLSINRFLNVIVSCAWCSFVQIQSISQKFNSCVTNLRTDGQTNTPSFRDAKTHLQTFLPFHPYLLFPVFKAHLPTLFLIRNSK